MKKIFLMILVIIPTFCLYGQMTDAEKHLIDSLLKSGELKNDQASQLHEKWKTLDYPEFKANPNTGEIEIIDILTFSDLDKKAIFRRCLEWIAINYGDLIYNDPESGKIIANGLIDLNHYFQYGSTAESKKIQKTLTPTNYTMILTVKDNKIKYTITNITYNFKSYSPTVDEVSFSISSFFPDKVLGPQWIRFATVINSSIDMFYHSLKESLINYVKDTGNDYDF